jgi:hypothetical protein
MSLTNLVKLNDQNISDEEISSLEQAAPFLFSLAAVPASNGTNHRYLYTSTASSAAFRALDTGVAKTKSAKTQVDITMKVLDASFSVDIAEAKAYRGGVDAYLELELQEALAQAFRAAEGQVIYGTDAAGFDGLVDISGMAALGTYVLSAGGSTASSQTSCWVMHTSPKEIAVIAGNDGNIEFTEEPSVVQIAEGGGYYTAYHTGVVGWLGLQSGTGTNLVRIGNIETAFDDADIQDALALFKDEPNLIVMNRKALKLLTQSRTATNPTGKEAPRPTEFEGIPIVVTSSITNTEAVLV